MVSAGLYLAGLLPRFSHIGAVGQPLFRQIAPIASRMGPIRTARGALLVGALWGFLPCGLVYAALSLALASGTAALGAVSMLAFGLGTLPTLVMAGGVAEVVRRLSRELTIRRTAGALIALSGALHLGLAAMSTGWVPARLLGDESACCADKH
jgi:sulfite exporter TauE/SafE